MQPREHGKVGVAHAAQKRNLGAEEHIAPTCNRTFIQRLEAERLPLKFIPPSGYVNIAGKVGEYHVVISVGHVICLRCVFDIGHQQYAEARVVILVFKDDVEIVIVELVAIDVLHACAETYDVGRTNGAIRYGVIHQHRSLFAANLSNANAEDVRPRATKAVFGENDFGMRVGIDVF